MSGLSLQEALEIPVFRQAEPVVVAGAGGLQRTMRWIHVTELPDIAELLRPGDLVLTTGLGLPSDDHQELADFARSLAEAGCVGLVVELGRRWTDQLPAALRESCDLLDLPLVALTHETRFAAITQAIGEQIVDRQLADLREAQRVHETFTELSFSQAEPAQILDAVHRLTHGPVVLESSDHRPLDFLAGDRDGTDFLANWQARSGQLRITGRTGWDEQRGWLVTRLGTSEQNWGRLVIAAPTQPSERMIAIAERAGAALALHRLHDRNRDNVTRRAHQEVMSRLRADPDGEETLRRCEVVGFPTRRRLFAALTIRRGELPRRSAGDHVVLDDVVAATVAATHAARVPALICEVEREVRVLLSCTATSDPDQVIDRLARRLRSQYDVVIAASRPVRLAEDIDQTMSEARQVMDAVAASPSHLHGGDAVVHRLDHLHLRGLLALLGDDERVKLFVQRELLPLGRTAEEREANELTQVLRALLTHPNSKTDAAVSLHLSRAAFYDRLGKLEQTLGVRLDDAEIRTSLHLALVADELPLPRA